MTSTAVCAVGREKGGGLKEREGESEGMSE